MFCTSLRRRASFAPGIAALSSHPLGLKESRLETHDVTLNLDATIDAKTGITLSTRNFKVLLFSPSAVAEARLNDTLTRIHDLSSLTGGQDLAIIFLLSPPLTSTFVSAKILASITNETRRDGGGMMAYTRLQAELLNHPEIPAIPILPLADINNLQERLQKHVSYLTQPRPSQLYATPRSSFDLLQLCTADSAMQQQTAFILSDLFSNIHELAECCTHVDSAPNSNSRCPRATAVYPSQLDLEMQSPNTIARGKLNKLQDLVGEEEYQGIIDFWKEEWTLD